MYQKRSQTSTDPENSLKTDINCRVAYNLVTKDTATKTITRMWANAQRDGRPAEYRWRPLFNAANFG